MPFGTNRQLSNSQLSNAVATTSSLATNNSILAQTLFNPNNQILFENHHHPTQQSHTDYSKQQQQQQPHQMHQAHAPTSTTSTAATSSLGVTSEALIVQSNSNVVSDEILQQLHEQIGEGKQIYVLNSEDDDNVQYLIVDKDTDISAILQDPSIFQAAAAASSGTLATGHHDTLLAAGDLNAQMQPQQQYIIMQDNGIEHADSQYNVAVANGKMAQAPVPNSHHIAGNNIAANHTHQSQVQINQSNKLNNLNGIYLPEFTYKIF